MSLPRSVTQALRAHHQSIAGNPHTSTKSWSYDVLYQALHMANKESRWWLTIRRQTCDSVRIRSYSPEMGTFTIHVQLIAEVGYKCTSITPPPEVPQVFFGPQTRLQWVLAQPPVSFGCISPPYVSRPLPPPRTDMVARAIAFVKPIYEDACQRRWVAYERGINKGVEYYFNINPDALKLLTPLKRQRLTQAKLRNDRELDDLMRDNLSDLLRDD